MKVQIWSEQKEISRRSVMGKAYPPVVLMGESFTKKQLEGWLKQVLTDGCDLLKASMHHQCVARKAVALYCKVYETGEAVARVTAAPNPEWGAAGGLCLHVHLQPSGSVITVSRAGVARSAFDPKGVQQRMAWWRLVEHMRRSVVPQILAFKRRHSQTRVVEGDPQTGWQCTLCDAFVCEKSKVHTDHIYEFNRLVRDYMGARPDIAWGSTDKLPDEADWVAWHEAHATLRVVCAGCNMGRPRPWASKTQ